jgi:hypothetical protein
VTQVVSRRSVPPRLGFDPRPIDVKFVGKDRTALGKVLLRVLRFFTVSTIPTMLHLHQHVPVTKRTKGRSLKTFQKTALFQKRGTIGFSYFLTSVLRGLIVSLNLINISSWRSRSTHGVSNVTLGNVVNLAPHWWHHDSVDSDDRAMTDYVCGANLGASYRSPVQLVTCLKHIALIWH